MRTKTLTQLGAMSLACLACVACGNDTIDYCAEEGQTADPPVGCNGKTVTVLATFTNTVERSNATVAWSRQTIALDEVYAYWSDVNGRLLRTPKQGGQTEELLPASACSIADVAVDETFVYFGQNCRIAGIEGGFPIVGRVARVDKAGGNELELASFEFNEIRYVQAAGEHVYFMTDDVVSSAVRRAARDGSDELGSSAPLVSVFSPHLPFVVQGSDLYYADNAGLRIERLPLEGGEAITVAEAADFVTRLQVIDGVLHWQIRDLDAANSTFLFRATSATAGQPALEGRCSELLIGDERGYYGVGDIDPDSSTALRVHRWLAPSFANELLAAGLNTPEGMAMDESRVYFTDHLWADEPQKLRLMSVPR
jgi:hypothetical protein